MDTYILDFKQNRNTWLRNASDITGLTEGTVQKTMRLERNRHPDGRFDIGWRYVVESRRRQVRVITLERFINA